MKPIARTKYGGREGVGMFRRMELEEIKLLKYGNHVWFRANDGSARRVRINGKVRRWKREPDRFEVPCKYGMYEYHTFRNDEAERLLVEVTPEVSVYTTISRPEP